MVQLPSYLFRGFSTLPTMNATASFMFFGVMLISGCREANTRKISSAKAWPMPFTRSKSRITERNFSSPDSTRRA